MSANWGGGRTCEIGKGETPLSRRTMPTVVRERERRERESPPFRRSSLPRALLHFSPRPRQQHLTTSLFQFPRYKKKRKQKRKQTASSTFPRSRRRGASRSSATARCSAAPRQRRSSAGLTSTGASTGEFFFAVFFPFGEVRLGSFELFVAVEGKGEKKQERDRSTSEPFLFTFPGFLNKPVVFRSTSLSPLSPRKKKN